MMGVVVAMVMEVEDVVGTGVGMGLLRGAVSLWLLSKRTSDMPRNQLRSMEWEI